jgi:hypothetical protein
MTATAQAAQVGSPIPRSAGSQAFEPVSPALEHFLH